MNKGEVVYERNLTGSYMKIKAEENAEFDEHMLLAKKIKGILEVEKCFLNGDAWYWYRISGKQSLDTYCRIQNIGKDFVEKVIMSICDEIDILEWNLFDLDCLVLDPEYIFINNINGEIIFTLYPGYHEELSGQLQQLMEYLLAKIDHNDAEAVKTAYSIYEKTLDEAYGIMDIRDTILLERNKKNRVEETGKFNIREGLQEDYGSVCIERRKQQDSLYEKDLKPSGRRSELPPEKKIWNKPEEKINDIFTSILQMFQNWKETLSRVTSQPISIKHAVAEKVLQKPETHKTETQRQGVQKPEIKEYGLGKSEYGKQEPFVVYPEDSYPQIPKEIHPTICLTDYISHPKGVLLYEGAEDQEDIRLPPSDSNIGKSETAEIRISKETISQYHAKINYREEEYYLEDLNSTNGTYINEEALAYKECRKLQVNDIVRFADVRFRFI